MTQADKEKELNDIQEAAKAVAQEKEAAKKAAITAAEKVKDEAIKCCGIVANDDFTVSGRLDVGVLANGKLHKSFKMRLETVSDSLNTKEPKGNAYILEVYARTLESLGELKKEEINSEFLKDKICGIDVDVLFYAQEELLKKLKSTNGV